MNLNALLKNKFALLFISVLLIVLVMPLMSGKLLLIFPFVLIILMLGVFRTLSLPKSLMIGCAGIGVLAAILHFAALFVASSGGDSQDVTTLMLGALRLPYDNIDPNAPLLTNIILPGALGIFIIYFL